MRSVRERQWTMLRVGWVCVIAANGVLLALDYTRRSLFLSVVNAFFLGVAAIGFAWNQTMKGRL
jgi:hypothetical protein